MTREHTYINKSPEGCRYPSGDCYKWEGELQQQSYKDACNEAHSANYGKFYRIA